MSTSFPFDHFLRVVFFFRKGFGNGSASSMRGTTRRLLLSKGFRPRDHFFVPAPGLHRPAASAINSKGEPGGNPGRESLDRPAPLRPVLLCARRGHGSGRRSKQAAFPRKDRGKTRHECRQPPSCGRYSYGQGRRVCQGQGRNFAVRRIRDPAGGPYTGAVGMKSRNLCKEKWAQSRSIFRNAMFP